MKEKTEKNKDIVAEEMGKLNKKKRERKKREKKSKERRKERSRRRHRNVTGVKEGRELPLPTSLPPYSTFSPMPPSSLPHHPPRNRTLHLPSLTPSSSPICPVPPRPAPSHTRPYPAT